MRTIEAYGKIEKGQLIISNRKVFTSQISELDDQDVILIVKKRGRRSNQQNRYYWGVVVQCVQLKFKIMGYRLTPEEVHNFLKEKFIPVHLYDGEGTILATFPGSTAKMNKGEFSDFVEQIRQWAVEALEVNIPDPNSPNELAFE